MAVRNRICWRTLFFIALLQLLFSCAVPVLFGMVVAAGQMLVVSDYRELDREGAIDHAKLEKIAGGHFAGVWTVVPRYFGRNFDSVRTLAWIVFTFYALTSVGLFAVWYACRLDKS